MLKEAIYYDDQAIKEGDSEDGARRRNLETEEPAGLQLYENEIIFKYDTDILKTIYYEKMPGEMMTEYFEAANLIADVNLVKVKGNLAQLDMFFNATLKAMFDPSTFANIDPNNPEPLIFKKAHLKFDHTLTLTFNKNLLGLKKRYVDMFVDSTVIYLGAQSGIEEDVVYPGHRKTINGFE